MAESPFLPFSSLPYWIISLSFLVYVHGGDYIPERVCGTLYSQNDFQGDSFTLNDFDVSADTRIDYRASLSGWLNTGSVRVKKECSMYVCSERYFKGTCHLLNENITHASPLISQVRSTNCTCARNCNCENVILPKHEYGRMYFKGGCQLCDTEYLSLLEAVPDFKLSQSIQTFRIRSGCNLTLYGDTDYKGFSSMHSDEIIENNFNTFKSYKVICDESAYTPSPSLPKAISDPPSINLPDTPQGLVQLVSTNDTMAKHPGIQAALKSLQNGRSGKNAYILVIGTNYIDFYLDTQGCGSAINGKIKECRMLQPLVKLGISNSEIRIIYYDWMYGLPSNEEDDFQFMASLDEYLSNHEELKYSLPNAIVLYWDVETANLLLQRQLRIINALGSRVVEDSYSNLIFYFGLGDRTDFRSGNTNVADIVKEINSNPTIPKPISYITFGHHDTVSGNRKYVNGFRKMLNGEYWPLNLKPNLQVTCRRSGDKLGEAIFTNMFVETGDIKKVSKLESNFVPKTHSLVEHYRRCSTENSASTCTNATQRTQPVSQFTDQTAINHKILQNFAGLHVKIQKLEDELANMPLGSNRLVNRVEQLEEELATQKNSRQADLERAKGELFDDIKRQLNILYGN